MELFRKKLRWKRLMKSRSRRAMRKLAKVNQQTHRRRYSHEVILPEIFSLINEPEPALLQFQTVQEKPFTLQTVLFNFSDVKTISLGAVAYLLSISSYPSNSRSLTKYRIRWPKDESARLKLENCGFEAYIKRRNKSDRDLQSDMFQIREGSSVDNTCLTELDNFINKHLPNLSNDTRKAVRTSLIECMENTMAHAYDPHNLGKDQNLLDINRSIETHGLPDKHITDAPKVRWWLMATLDSETGDIVITFLDQGRGIPATVNKTGLEIIRDNVAYPPKDSTLLASAMKGEARSQTKKKHRGRGLKWIDKYAQEGILANLVVISGKGYYLSDNGANDLQSPLRGTLFSWRVLKNETGTV